MRHRRARAIRPPAAHGRAWAAAILRTEVPGRAGPAAVLRSIRPPPPIAVRHVARRPTVALRTNMARGRRRSTAILRTEVPSRTRAAAILRAMCACRAIAMPHITSQPAARTAAVTRGHYSTTRELARPRSGGNRRPTVGHRLSEVPVGRRKMLMVPLHRRRLEVTLMLRAELVCRRADMQTTGAAVEAATIHGDVVDNRPVVYVRHVNPADVTDRSVVEECPTTPVTALESNTGVSEAVVATAIA